MGKNTLLDEFRKSIPANIKRDIDLSFAIADRIFEILQKQGRSQRYLANALGKRESEISKWLRGTHNFTTTTITRIEAVLGESIIEVTGKPLKPEYIFISLPSENKYTSVSPSICEINDMMISNSWTSARLNKNKNGSLQS